MSANAPLSLTSDPQVAVAQANLAEARRTRATAQAARDALGYPEAGVAPPLTLKLLQADDALAEATARVRACEHLGQVAREMAATRLRLAFRDRHKARLTAALAAARALDADLTVDLADRGAVADALGLVNAAEHPHVDAQRLVEAIGRSLRQLDPPAQAPKLAPRPGEVLVRALQKFQDSAGRQHWPDDGSIDVMPEADVRVVITKNKWAELVEG